MKSKFILAAILLVCPLGSQADAAVKYRGPGGQVEAAGMIVGTYMTISQTIEACERHAELKTRAQKSLRDYLHKNQQVYMDVMRKLPELAKANGGDAEVKRLKAELETGFAYILAEAKKSAPLATNTIEKSKAFLDSVDKGIFDLKIKHNNEVTKILK